METFANAGRIQCHDMISTMRQRLEALEDSIKKKMEEMKCNCDELTNMRRAKETLLQISLQHLMQEKEKTTALEKNITDAVSQNIKQSTQIQKLECIKSDLQATILEEQRLRHESMQNVSELQLELQKMAMKLHEVEGHLIDMESKWVITPLVQSYSGKPRARSFSADQVLNQKRIKSGIPSRISVDYGNSQRSNKRGKTSVLKHLRHSTSPNEQSKIVKSRRSTGQICSAAVEPIIESPPATSIPEAKVDNVSVVAPNDKIVKDSVTMLDVPQTSVVKSAIEPIIVSPPVTSTPVAEVQNVSVEAPNESMIAKDSVSTVLDVPQTNAVKAAVQEFEKLSPKVVMKGAVPKKRQFQASKQEREVNPNTSHVQHNVGGIWKPHHQSLAVPSSHPQPGVMDEVTGNERSTTKRCLSPTVCVSRVKKLRVEELKSQQRSLLPRLKKVQSLPHQLQQESLRSTLICATRREDVLTIRRLAAFRGGGRLLDAPVVDVFKFTPLHLAASWGHMESARALLDSGAALEVQDWVNSTPLHIAAFWGHAKICRLLLGRGAQIKARNCNEETPLHLAARQGHLQVVRLMVDDWWADIDAKDSTGRTAWDVAQFWNKSLVANWLARQCSFKKRFGRQNRSNSVPCAMHLEE